MALCKPYQLVGGADVATELRMQRAIKQDLSRHGYRCRAKVIFYIIWALCFMSLLVVGYLA